MFNDVYAKFLLADSKLKEAETEIKRLRTELEKAIVSVKHIGGEFRTYKTPMINELTDELVKELEEAL